MMRRPGEYLWRQDVGDWFRLRTQNPMSVIGVFREFLKSRAPGHVVFCITMSTSALEVLREIKLTLPDCVLIVTLHEYVAICNRNGQMVKNKTKKLCYRESIGGLQQLLPRANDAGFLAAQTLHTKEL